MPIKVLSFGNNAPESSINVIQRCGKKIALALCISIDLTADQVLNIGPTTSVDFGIEEVPLTVATKVLTDTEEGEPAFVALEGGKPVSDEARKEIAGFIKRSVGTLAA